MSHLPPSVSTSLAIDRLLGTTVECGDDHLVVRTPGRPAYHWGNGIHVTSGDVDDADRWLRVFRAAFPDARYRAIGLPRRPRPTAWARCGLRIEAEQALVMHGRPAATASPAEYTVQAFDRDGHWAARRDAELAENARGGEYSDADHRVFVEADIAARRRLVDAGRSAWFGAFASDGSLAASLGIVALGSRARYQYVLTDPAHRRRGLARHLLAVAARWAAERGAAELVIVADAGSDAARLYARAGFVPGAIGYSAYTPAVERGTP